MSYGEFYNFSRYLEEKSRKLPNTGKKLCLRASAADTLTEVMGNVYLGSSRSAFGSATQKGPVLPCDSGEPGCHYFYYVDHVFTITSYFDDDGDITDKDSEPDTIVTIVRTD